MIYFDTETCGLHGLAVLLQYAKDDGPIHMHNFWKSKVRDSMKLIEEMLDELKLDDQFTSATKDDTITHEQSTVVPLKGVMNSAFVGVPGSEVEFLQTHPDSPERQYYLK